MVNFFIQRPIFASAIAIIMVLAGAICYFLLPVSQFPDITPPQVVVSAIYPGASAQVVADTVTTPLEQQINGVQGMTYMSSSSSNDGSSTITVTFDVGYPLDIAAVDVQNRVSQAASSLPRDRQPGRRDDQEAEPELRPDRQPDLARRLGRSGGAQQLRLSADRRPAEAPAGRRRRADLRRAALFDARLARSRQARQSRHHRRRRAERHRRAERPGRGRQDRPVAGAGRHAVRDAGQRRRPPERPEASSATSSCGPIPRTARSCGCATSRASNSARCNIRPPASSARTRRVVLARLPDAGLERARPAAARQGQDGGTVEALPEGHRLRDALRHDALRVGLDARRGDHARRSAGARRRSWCSSSCRAGARRSSRPSPSRCR